MEYQKNYRNFLKSHRWSTFVLVCFSWLLNHVIYLKLRIFFLLLHFGDFECTCTLWFDLPHILSVATKVFLFSSWDKSRELNNFKKWQLLSLKMVLLEKNRPFWIKRVIILWNCSAWNNSNYFFPQLEINHVIQQSNEADDLM